MNLERQFFVTALLAFAGFGNPAFAQSNSAGPGDTTQPSSQIGPASASQASTKKVWTNDDLSDLRGNAAVSTVGSTKAVPTKSGDKPSSATRNRDAKSYRDQIAKLQAQIPPIDSQIAELQAAIDGKPTGDAKESTRPRNVKIDDWSVEMQQLQKKRDDIQTRIDATQDQARRHGITDNELP